MTETELSKLDAELQNLLQNENYAGLFKRLAQYHFFKCAELTQLQNVLITGFINHLFHQRIELFIHKRISEERDKMSYVLDQVILEKELRNFALSEEISRQEQLLEDLNLLVSKIDLDAIDEKQKQLDELNQQIHEAEAKLGDLSNLANKEEEARKLFHKASKLLNYSDKISIYNKAIELKPDFAYAYFERGKAKCNLLNYREGIEDFTKAIQYEPYFAEAYFERGFVNRIWFSKNQESLGDFTQTIWLIPKHNRAYFSRGLVNKELKNYEDAIADYQKHFELNPTSPIYLVSIAECYSLLKDKIHTLQYLAEAIKLDNSCKETCKQNKDFKWLWRDADFKRLVG